MASPNKGATERTFSPAGLRSGGMAMVFVTTISLTAGWLSRSAAGGESVRGQDVDLRPGAARQERLDHLFHAPAGIDDVLDDDRGLALDIADEVGGLGDIMGRAPLVHHADGQVQHGGQFFGLLDAARIRAMITPFGTALCLTYCASIGRAVMWSTGILKKPWMAGACKSMVMIRSAPTVVIISATIRAVIGSRGADFFSCRA